jgi:polysaccharide biosynthesis/export protein
MFPTKNGLRFSILLISSLLAIVAYAQQPVAPPQEPASGQNPATNSNPAAPAIQPHDLPPDAIRPNYVLGTNDQILVRAPQADEINEKPFRIDADGNINMPLLGRVHVAGMTVQEMENDLVQRLREYIREPQVIITVVQFRSSPVFFLGAFNKPGIYPLQGGRTLVEMLASIGGTQPNASRHLKITRRAEYGPIPLPNAVEDPEKKVSTVEISIGSLRENVNPAEDILLQPYDVISIERAEQIYLNGEVGRVAPIEMGERESITIAQALSMAGGFTRDAAKGKVRILRPVLGTNRRAVIEVDVKRIFDGKDNDIPLLPNDILYVPRSYQRVYWQTLSQIALSLVPYMVFLAFQ